MSPDPDAPECLSSRELRRVLNRHAWMMRPDAIPRLWLLWSREMGRMKPELIAYEVKRRLQLPHYARYVNPPPYPVALPIGPNTTE